MKSVFKILTILLLLVVQIAWGQNTENLPASLYDFYNQDKIKTKFTINKNLNPVWLIGDFDGDQKPDYALSISEITTGKKGILIYHPHKKNCFIIGAGKALSNKPSDDYSWVNAWEVSSEKNPELGVGESKRVKLKGQAILVQKLESSSGLIYWNGKNYQWYQQGD